MIKAKAQKREAGAGENKVAGVIYGPTINGSVNIELDRVAAEKLYDQAGRSSIIGLAVDGDAKEHEVLIKGVSFHPLTGRIVHLEFYQVPEGQKIEAEIELEFIGVAPAEKALGGVVNRNLSSLPVKCFAADLVSSIQVDLSVLKTFDDFIRVADLKLPKGVEAAVGGDVIVATAVEVKAETAAPAVEAAAVPAADAAKKESPAK